MSLLWKQALATVNVAYGRRFATRGASLSSAMHDLLSPDLFRGPSCIASQSRAATASTLESDHLLFWMNPKILTARVAGMALLRVCEVGFNLFTRNRLVAARADRVNRGICVVSSCERYECRHRITPDRLPVLSDFEVSRKA
jgi:hypothetical protein